MTDNSELHGRRNSLLRNQAPELEPAESELSSWREETLTAENPLVSIPFGDNYFTHKTPAGFITGVVAMCQPCIETTASPRYATDDEFEDDEAEDDEVPTQKGHEYLQFFISDYRHLPPLRRQLLVAAVTSADPEARGTLARDLDRFPAAIIMNKPAIESVQLTKEMLINIIWPNNSCYIGQRYNRPRELRAFQERPETTNGSRKWMFAQVAFKGTDLEISLPDNDSWGHERISGLTVRLATLVQPAEAITAIEDDTQEDIDFTRLGIRPGGTLAKDWDPLQGHLEISDSDWQHNPPGMGGRIMSLKAPPPPEPKPAIPQRSSAARGRQKRRWWQGGR